MRGGRGEGLDKDLAAFPPRGAVLAPHRLALHWASLVRSCFWGGCGTCSWPGTAARATPSSQSLRLSALEIKTQDYKRHRGTGTAVDELAKRASPDQKWSLPWEGDDPNEEKQGTWHGTPASPLTSHLIKEGAVELLHLQPQIYQHKESVNGRKKAEKNQGSVCL